MSKKKDHSFHYFFTSESNYKTIRSLPWIEVIAESRELNFFGDTISTVEKLKVAGKKYVVGYRCATGQYAIREKYRFACDGLAAMKFLMESGGLTTECDIR